MVCPETVSDEKTLSTAKVWAETVNLKRYQNGRWVSYVEIEVRTQLPDGRIISGKQKVSVQCGQAGRKDGRT